MNIFEYLRSIIDERNDIEDGKTKLIAYITEVFPEYDVTHLHKIDFYDIMTQFIVCVRNILYFEPYNESIRALWFGFFSGNIGKKPSATATKTFCFYLFRIIKLTFKVVR